MTSTSRTSRVAGLEKIVPTLLFATHLYSLLSALSTFVIVNCFAFDDKVTLGFAVVFTGEPPTVHENDGAGFPMASQDIVTLSPSVIYTPCG